MCVFGKPSFHLRFLAAIDKDRRQVEEDVDDVVDTKNDGWIDQQVLDVRFDFRTTNRLDFVNATKM